MAEEENSLVTENEVKRISWKAFLELQPPGKTLDVVLLVDRRDRTEVDLPDLYLYCDNPSCVGMRFFKKEAGYASIPDQSEWKKTFIDYICRNCGKCFKRFAIAYYYDKTNENHKAYKFGEMPPFGPSVPSKVSELVGEDRDLFFTGRRAESQGMGIGAFTYYRRVVENQKNRILDEIIKVAEKIQAKPEIIETLKRAKEETQFSTAVESIKDAMPESLLIDGRNPLTLLHRALSQGLHAETDEECLGLATSIRVILAELAERMSQALKDDAQLKGAVSRLLQLKSSKKTKDKDNRPTS